MKIYDLSGSHDKLIGQIYDPSGSHGKTQGWICDLVIPDPDPRDPDPVRDLGIRAHVCLTLVKKMFVQAMSAMFGISTSDNLIGTQPNLCMNQVADLSFINTLIIKAFQFE